LKFGVKLLSYFHILKCCWGSHENNTTSGSGESVGKKLGEALIWVVDKFDACLDQHEISLHLARSEIRKGLFKLRAERKVRIRILTEITNENLAEIISIIPSAEIRHLDNIRTNFVVADGNQNLGYALDMHSQVCLRPMVYQLTHCNS
jgi:hypothetical protein